MASSGEVLLFAALADLANANSRSGVFLVGVLWPESKGGR